MLYIVIYYVIYYVISCHIAIPIQPTKNSQPPNRPKPWVAPSTKLLTHRPGRLGGEEPPVSATVSEACWIHQQDTLW